MCLTPTDINNVEMKEVHKYGKLTSLYNDQTKL